MNKKSVLFASLATLLFTACNNNTCKVEAYIDNMPNSKFYWVDKLNNTVVDSAFVSDGTLSFAIDVDTAYIATIVDVTNVAADADFLINDEVVHYDFIAEPGGKIKIDLNKNLLIDGSQLNIDYVAYNDANRILNKKMQSLNDSLLLLMENQTLTPEEAESAFYAGRDNLNKDYALTLESMLSNHTGDVVGAIMLNSYLSKCDDDQRIDSILTTMKEYVLQYPTVNRKVRFRINFRETAEGMPFKDFSVAQEDGSTVALSDYVGKGQYVLADFWASWCPPCRKSMPLLKNLYNECNDKGLIILGLATRDKVQNSLRAIEEEQMPWPQILGDNSPAAETYGVNGIPHLILFAPDGTIALRGYPDEEFLNKVKDLIVK